MPTDADDTVAVYVATFEVPPAIVPASHTIWVPTHPPPPIVTTGALPSHVTAVTAVSSAGTQSMICVSNDEGRPAGLAATSVYVTRPPPLAVAGGAGTTVFTIEGAGSTMVMVVVSVPVVWPGV